VAHQPEDKDMPLGLGDMMGFNTQPSARETAPLKRGPEQSPGPVVADHAPSIKAESPSAPESQRVLPAAPQSTLHRMKEQGQFRQHYFKEVECFECHNKSKVGRSAKTSGCPACGATICLEDFDINISSTSPIHTRGDVLIRKTATINTSEIICRDLRVFGSVSARIDCSGEFLLRCTGTIIGEITCKKLVIEKGCDVHVLNVIHASEVDVRARIFANIHCTGAIHISPTGWVHGDVTARSVSIEPGGQLDGSMNILRSTPSPLPSILSGSGASQSALPFAEKSA
jgi:cytoskeletal protein CcmA (bactofilin family)/ribosomal protein S27E